MRGQSSTEYILAMIGLLLTLAALYEVSASMNARLGLMQAQMEGERAAAQLGRALEAVSEAGPGAQAAVRLYTSPPQRLMLNASDIAVLGADRPTAAFLRHLAVLASGANISANQSVRIYYDSGGEHVEGLGS